MEKQLKTEQKTRKGNINKTFVLTLTEHYIKTPHILWRDFRLTDGAVRLYGALLTFGESFEIVPNTTSALCGCSPNSFRKHLKELVKYGYMEKIQNSENQVEYRYIEPKSFEYKKELLERYDIYELINFIKHGDIYIQNKGDIIVRFKALLREKYPENKSYFRALKAVIPNDPELNNDDAPF